MWQTPMAQPVLLDISSTSDATYRRDVVSLPFERRWDIFVKNRWTGGRVDAMAEVMASGDRGNSRIPFGVRAARSLPVVLLLSKFIWPITTSHFTQKPQSTRKRIISADITSKCPAEFLELDWSSLLCNKQHIPNASGSNPGYSNYSFFVVILPLSNHCLRFIV